MLLVICLQDYLAILAMALFDYPYHMPFKTSDGFTRPSGNRGIFDDVTTKMFRLSQNKNYLK